MTLSLVFKTRQPEKRECSFLLVSERKASLFLEAHNSSLKHIKIYLHVTLYVAQKKMEKTFKILFKLSFVTISQFSIFVTFFFAENLFCRFISRARQ